MLNRVTAALAQWIKPIQTVTDQRVEPALKEHVKDEPKKKKKKASLKLVEGGEKTAAPETAPSTPQAQTPVTTELVSTAEPFIQLAALYEKTRELLKGLTGKEAYEYATKNQKISAKIRKGALLDDEIE